MQSIFTNAPRSTSKHLLDNVKLRNKTKRKSATCSVLQGLFLASIATIFVTTFVSIQHSLQFVTQTSRRASDALPLSSMMTSTRGMVSETGILSTKDASFFREIQRSIDSADPIQRCRLYGGTYNATHPTHRRIFFGALIASEPLELLHIVAAEVYGLYDAMVFVESNRTQNFTPRTPRLVPSSDGSDSIAMMADLFGVEPSMMQIRPYINEKPRVQGLAREHDQRAEIIRGWKALGMTVNDVGLLADMDETLTRNFLKAVQTCDGLDPLDYTTHYCHHSKVKLLANSRIFEASPECMPSAASARSWYHPDLILGHCIEGIGGIDAGAAIRSRRHRQLHQQLHFPLHPPAPRTKNSYLRAEGFGKTCSDWDGETNITNRNYPLWNAADFRRTCGGRQVSINTSSSLAAAFSASVDSKMTMATATVASPLTTAAYDRYTGYHFHNFFANINSTRFKYQTYGHADPNATVKPIQRLSRDLKLVYNCIHNKSSKTKDRLRKDRDSVDYMQGGYEQLALQSRPVYFQDADYRRRRHDHVKRIFHADGRWWRQQQKAQLQQLQQHQIQHQSSLQLQQLPPLEPMVSYLENAIQRVSTHGGKVGKTSIGPLKALATTKPIPVDAMKKVTALYIMHTRRER